MSLTQNLNIVPFSLTGLSNFNGTVNGNNVLGSITIAGQTAYLIASAPDANGNMTLTLQISTASSSGSGLLSSLDWSAFNSKENGLTFTSPLLRTSNTVSLPNITISENATNRTNNFIGNNVGNNTTGTYSNTLIGRAMGQNLTGLVNVIIGDQCCQDITSGYLNTVIGCSNLPGATSLYRNCVLGISNGSNLTDLNFCRVVGVTNNVNHNNCTVIGSSITTQQANACYLAPVRNDASAGLSTMQYNTATKEVTYTTASSSYTGTLPIQVSGSTISCGDGYFNLFVGQGAGRYIRNQNSYNVGLGYNAMYNTTSTAVTNNVAIGRDSMGYDNVTGSYNVGVGMNSCMKLTSGSFNVGLGFAANYSGMSTYMNVGVGYAANYNSVSSSYNVGIGPYTNFNYDISGGTAIGYGTNYVNPYNNCLHISAGSGSTDMTCNGAGQWMGPKPWQYNTGGYYVSTGFGPVQNLIGYYYSSYLSDARTKSDIQDADTNYYYDLIKQMRVRNFKYNDGKNSMNVGLITQEMEQNDSLRFLIETNEGYTFDINGYFKFDNVKMMVANVIKKLDEETKEMKDIEEMKEKDCLKIYIDTVKHGLKAGDYIRYSRDRDRADADFIEMEAEILDCTDTLIIIENTDYIGIKDIGHNDTDLTTIFIEGKWVSDIKLIKKDAMAFVLLPAMQQLQKENENLKARLQTIEAKLDLLLQAQ